MRIPKIAFSVCTYTNSSSITEITKKCIQNIRNNGGEYIICTNHLPGSSDLIELCDTYLYDSNNILTTHDFFDQVWQNHNSFKATIKLSKTGNNIYHGPAVHQSLYSGILVAKSLGFDYVICTNFDTHFSENEFEKLYSAISEMESSGKSGFFLYNQESEGDVLKTVTFIINPDFYLDNFKNICNENDYNEMVKESGSNTNSLENVYYHILKSKLDQLLLVRQHETEFFNESTSFTNSQCEYYAVLPITGNYKDKENTASIYFYFSNKDDNRIARYYVYENGKTILVDEFKVTGNVWYYKPFKIENGMEYKIHFEVKGDEGVKSKVVSYKNYEEICENGSLEFF